MRARRYGVVPVTMEGVAVEIDGVECGVGDFDTLWIFVLVEFCAHSESSASCGCGDQLNNGLEASQGFPSPVDRYEGKEAMFDLVPLAGAGWQMANGDGNAQSISQCLQFHFPQPHTVPIA